jgi:hypothetical protein
LFRAGKKAHIKPKEFILLIRAYSDGHRRAP